MYGRYDWSCICVYSRSVCDPVTFSPPGFFVCVHCSLETDTDYLFSFTVNQSPQLPQNKTFSCQKPYSPTLCISHTHPTPCDHTSLIQIGSTSLHTSESTHVWNSKFHLLQVTYTKHQSGRWWVRTYNLPLSTINTSHRQGYICTRSQFTGWVTGSSELSFASRHSSLQSHASVLTSLLQNSSSEGIWYIYAQTLITDTHLWTDFQLTHIRGTHCCMSTTHFKLKATLHH